MKKEILRISYKYIFLLIIAAILCVGTVSARYSSSNSYSLGNNVGNFNYTFTVDGISSTSFANLDYYAADSVTVNTGAAVRYISFSLESNESEVTADTTFYFSADYEFLSNIAFQIVSVGDDNTLTPVTPQYVMSELLDGDGVTDGYKDYGEITYTGLYYKNLNVTADAANKTFTATANSYYGDITISLSTDSTAHSVTYMYGRGPLREVAGGETYVETDSDISVYVESEEDTRYYSTLQISMPEFNMAPESDKTFRFYFTTIKKIELADSKYSYAAIGNNSETYSVSDVDSYENSNLSGTSKKITITVDNSGSSPAYYYTSGVVDYQLTQINGTVYGNDSADVYIDLNSSISCVEYYYNVKDVYAYSNEGCTDDETRITVKVKKSGTDTSYYYVSSGGDIELSQINSTVYGNADERIYIDTSTGNFGIAGSYDSTENYSIESEPTGIIYPMTLNILFAQSEQS